MSSHNSGCWVTRIDLKQALRRNEYLVREAETWAALAACAGSPWPAERHESLWERLLFTMFHDAVTATHVDAAYDELRDINAGLAADAATVAADALASRRRDQVGALTVLNPLGRPAAALVELPTGTWSVQDGAGQNLPVVPSSDGRSAVRVADVPALGGAVVRIKPSSAPAVRTLEQAVIRNRRYEVQADQTGIVEIRDLALGRTIARRGACSPGEFVLESDIGSPWATLEPSGEPMPLGRHTRLVAAEAGEGWQRLRFVMEGWGNTFRGLHGGMRGVDITSEVLLVDGLDRVEFRSVVDWDNYNVRLRQVFPTTVGNGAAWYGVPYGMLPRDPYPAEYGWSTANGDHPAIEWAGVQADDLSVAVLDAGTPSYRIRRGVIEVSLLRSPSVPTFLHEPVSYSMTGFDGMRDAGRHEFRLALTSYDRPFVRSAVVHDAEAFNHVFTARPGVITPWPAPQIAGEGVRLGAVTSLGDRLLLRLAETRGVAGEAVLTLPTGMKTAERSDLRGQSRTPMTVAGGAVRVPLRAWEIATVLVG